jgi:hypothetical protein
MGMELVHRYEQVGLEMGAIGRMKLAMLTKLSSVHAADVEDSASNLKMVDDAIAQLRKGM